MTEGTGPGDLQGIIARYYDPAISMWISADPGFTTFIPIFGETADDLPGYGGVFQSRNLQTYLYAWANPLLVVDPDGRDIYIYFQAGGPGHLGIAVDDPKRPGRIRTFDYGMAGWRGNPGLGTKARAVLQSSPAYLNTKTRSRRWLDRATSEYVQFETTEEFDAQMLKELESTQSDEKVAHGTAEYPRATKDYNAVGTNCADYCEAALESATRGEFSDTSIFPDSTFGNIKKSRQEIQEAIDRASKKGPSRIDFKNPRPVAPPRYEKAMP